MCSVRHTVFQDQRRTISQFCDQSLPVKFICHCQQFRIIVETPERKTISFQSRLVAGLLNNLPQSLFATQTQLFFSLFKSHKCHSSRCWPEWNHSLTWTYVQDWRRCSLTCGLMGCPRESVDWGFLEGFLACLLIEFRLILSWAEKPPEPIDPAHLKSENMSALTLPHIQHRAKRRGTSRERQHRFTFTTVPQIPHKPRPQQEAAAHVAVFT